LADCLHFTLDQYRVPAGATLRLSSTEACAVVTCIAGGGLLTTEEGGVSISSMRTALVPAVAQSWQVRASSEGLEVLVAKPRL
jgi:mannose-6-phosphate isomerase class I